MRGRPKGISSYVDDIHCIQFDSSHYAGYTLRVTMVYEPTEDEIRKAKAEGREPEVMKETLLIAYVLSRNEFLTLRRYVIKWIENCHFSDHCHYTLITKHYTGGQVKGGISVDDEYITAHADVDGVLGEIRRGKQDYGKTEKEESEDGAETEAIEMVGQKNEGRAEVAPSQGFKPRKQPKKGRPRKLPCGTNR